MREIEFRGKRIGNGEWLVSKTVVRADGGFFLALPDAEVYGDYRNRAGVTHLCCNKGFLAEVSPKTVGQYTGLKDKNEIRIFEGDVLIVNSSYHGLDEENGAAVVNWSEEDCKWVIGYPGLQFDLGSFYSAQLETVGNIYDNPELLEAQH